MLHEVKGARQVQGEGPRRWFTDVYFDLIVWYDEHGGIDGFQLCYDKFEKERALTWRKAGGFRHEKVDDGEVTLQIKMTPILLPDGLFDAKAITERFSSESTEIDPSIARFVLGVLETYPK